MIVRCGLVVNAVVWLAALAGCVAVDRKAGFTDVAKDVRDRTGNEIRWIDGPEEEAQVAEFIRTRLAEPLSIQSATQIALLNNHGLRATFEELGIARAELVQAGLLRNPSLFASVRFPDSAPSGTNFELAIVLDVLDALFIPLRKELAEAEFEQARRRVADESLLLVTEVKRAYYLLVGAAEIAATLQLRSDAADAGSEFAQRLNDAGNIADLDLAREQALRAEARLDLARAESEVMAARERMNTVMGLWGRDARWDTVAELPHLPNADPSLENIESVAVSQRLDLEASRRQVAVVERALTLTRAGLLTSVELGASTERDSGGQLVTGPTLQLDLPIFDQHQARIARLESQLRQARHRLSALAVQARSEVREIRDRLVMSRYRAAYYRDAVIPLHERIVALTLEQYNFMLVGADELLAAKRGELDARRGYVESLRDYWLARTDLERAVGGQLPALEDDTTAENASPPTSPAPAIREMSHDHHGAQRP